MSARFSWSSRSRAVIDRPYRKPGTIITLRYDLRVTYDVVIIGAGAAGLMCAIEAGKRGRSVAVLERNEAVGKKIRISGGGRCNFTNIHTAPENFISGNPNFHKSALARYTPDDFIRLVRRHRISYHEKKLGQLFCDGSSQQIIHMLLKECEARNVSVRINCSVTSIKKDGNFTIKTTAGEIESRSCVIATGGLSIPKIGVTDLGYRIARQFDLSVRDVRPALVPLTLGGDEGRSLRKLSGVSLDAEVSCGRVMFPENMLFTHKGLSGPAILQISSYWRPGGTIGVVPKQYPRRFVQKWRELYGDIPMEKWTLTPSGTEGYDKAEVTLGGVDTNELSSKTMESRRVPGLYFVGEVVDVTGQLGGFNFQWAWASGFVAGQFV
jgi:predicted flavoprotein YhiN